MTLFKRGRVWWTGFYVEGKRYQFSTNQTTRQAAEKVEQKLKEREQLARFNIAVADPHLTFSELVREFKKKAKTSVFHKGRLVFLEAYFGETPVIRISRNSIQEYRTARQEARPGLKDSTLNRDVAVIRRVFYWAHEQGLIAQNPLTRVGMVRERRVKTPILSLAHENLILAVAKPHLRDMIVTALDTGMRRGEIFQQQWEDVDLTHGVLYVSKSKTPGGDGREIPMTKRVKDLLMQKASKLSSTVGPVFTYQGNQVGDLKRSWETAQRDAKLPIRYRFHDARHTFATRLMEAGVGQDVRMALMGHQPAGVHWGYIHIELGAKREAIWKLERWRTRREKRK